MPGCSNHHVSPWGPGGPPPLSLYAEPPDLDGRLALVDEETRRAGLTLDLERRIELARGGGPLVLRVYTGVDSLGRKIHAVRAVTLRGVIMAVGPLRADDLERSRATELVPALAAGLLSDLTGDGAPDLVLRAEDGHLELWSLGPTTAVQIEVDMEVRPTDLEDVDGDGSLELVGRASTATSDPIGPVLIDVGAFDGEGFSNQTPVAAEYHAARARARTAMMVGAKSDEARVRASLERAWHEVLAGEDPDEVLERLDDVRVPPALLEAFEAHRRRIAAAHR